MYLLYPSDPLNYKQPDKSYRAEHLAARQGGIPCSLFSMEDFDQGHFRAYPPLPEQSEVIYRGWMLTPEAYARLHLAVADCAARMLTSVDQYRHCHHLPEWYPLCADLTPETVFADSRRDYAAALAGRQWPGYFVKDYVKSLTTSRGSVANSLAEIEEIVSLIERFRGGIEGGVCIRELEELRPDSEERYFVFKGHAFSRHGEVPQLVETIAERIDSPFYSVDVAEDCQGRLLMIELGDGQVSDIKQWTPKQFVALFAGVSA